jgi:hypothetical protein
MILNFWQLLAEETVVCSDSYTNNHRRSQELCLGASRSNTECASSRRRRRRGVGTGRVRVPLPAGEGSEEGAIHPPRKIFEFFIWKLYLLVDSGALKFEAA